MKCKKCGFSASKDKWNNTYETRSLPMFRESFKKFLETGQSIVIHYWCPNCGWKGGSNAK